LYDATSLVKIKEYSEIDNQNQLFDTIVVIENYPLDRRLKLKNSKLAVGSYSMLETTPYDMTIGITIFDDIEVTFNYSGHRFDRDIIVRLANHFRLIVERILMASHMSILEIEIISEEEKKKIQYEFNRTEVGYPGDKTIHQLFTDQVEKTPDRTALLGLVGQIPEPITNHEASFRQISDGFGVGHLSYRELNEQSEQLAGVLMEKRVRPDTIVGVMMERSVEMMVGILGILKAGAAYLPIDPDYPGERISYMLRDSHATILVTTPGLSEKFEQLSYVNCQLLMVNESSLGSHRHQQPWDNSPATSLAYIIYTSGSTGKTKGVMVQHDSLVNLVCSQKRRYNIDENDRVLQFSSYCFDASVEQIFISLTSGAVLVLINKSALLDGDKFEKIISGQSVTHLNAVPSFLNRIPLGNKDTYQLKRIISGGDSCPLSLAETLSCYCDFYNAYGPTETTVTSAMVKYEPGNFDETSVFLPIGQPIDNTLVYLLDKAKQMVPPGVPGELVVGGKGVSRGYLNNPELTAEKFVLAHSSLLLALRRTEREKNALTECNPPGTFQGIPGTRSRELRYNPLFLKAKNQEPRAKLYRTGDLARWLEDGNIEFLGRIDTQVKIRGFRIELIEIERLLLKHQDIKNAVVMAQEDTQRESHLYAFIISERELVVSELRAYLARELPGYMIPAYFIPIDQIPLTSAGKVDKKALNLKASTTSLRLGTGKEFVSPKSDIEKNIARIWKRLLGMDRVSIHDNFFDLGGNSLSMLRLNTRLKRVFKRDIPIVTLFNHPTISSLARYIRGEEKEREILSTVKADRGKETRKRGKEIAVIGMAGRFPGARHIDEYWNNLKSGVESITFFNEEKLKEAGLNSHMIGPSNYVPAKGGMPDLECFDASFFGYAPAQVKLMDPQMRIFHECVWEALEDAGYNPEEGNKAIGLYSGATINPFWLIQPLLSEEDSFSQKWQSQQLADKDFLSARIAYKLDLKGPIVSLQTACSTSLVAVDMACHGLQSGNCDMALAGGVSVTLHDQTGYVYQEGMVMSPDGHCRAFDARAGGIVGGNGAGVVLLKPLKEAINEGDHIYAVIRGSAVNNDGNDRLGFTAPSQRGQVGVIRAALIEAGVSSESIGYIEAHGTGTTLGDPIELQALKDAFNTGKRGFCALGSVKTNLGHLDAAAGVAGLIKTVLVLKHKRIPPTINFEIPNPQIDFINSPFYVNTRLQSWQNEGYPMRAGISSFGIGGTNAHVILEEWPIAQGTGISPSFPSRNFQLILLSAKTRAAQEGMTQNLGNYLKKNPDINLADVAYTLQVGRKPFQYRTMFVCSSVEEAVDIITSGEEEKIHSRVIKDQDEYDYFREFHAPRVSPGTEPPEENFHGERFLRKIGDSWLQGRLFDWRELWTREKRHRISLPTYPFERQQFPLNIDNFQVAVGKPTADGVLKRKPTITDWFYTPTWKPSVFPFPGDEQSLLLLLPSRCLIFVDDIDFGYPLVEKLQGGGKEIFCVKIGEEFIKEDTHHYRINFRESSDYERLFDDLNRLGEIPPLLIHLWGITSPAALGDRETGYPLVARLQETGFYSLLYIARAVGRLYSSWNHRLSIMVVTNQMQKMPGEEELSPGKATILGAIKVIPREYPFIHCRSIDIHLSHHGNGKQDRFYRQLLAEFTLAGDGGQVIALRGHERLVQSYESVLLNARAQLSPRLRPKGVYLITGGLGGVGLEIAGYLAKNVQARLLLTGRSPFPPPEQWDRWLSGELSTDRQISAVIAGEVYGLYQLEEELFNEYNIWRDNNREALEKTTDEFCGLLVYDYFKQCNIDMAKGQSCNKADLMERLKILPKFGKFFDFFIRVLEEEGFIGLAGSRVEFLPDPTEVKESRRLRKEAEHRYPAFKGTFRLLQHCASRYPQALSGEIEAISVLFPENQPLHLHETYRNQVEYSTSLIYCRLLHSLVLKVLEKLNKHIHREIKILEIGAGTGTLTRLIAPGLRNHRVRYYFTDIGKYFLLNARKDEVYRELAYMTFERLDISKDPVKQGYEPYDFDIILGLNVVHATPDILVTLGHLKKLLAAGGMIALIETVQFHRWMSMVDGLAEGWWYFDDEDYRKDSPLMELEKWKQAFQNRGFKDVILFPALEDEEKRCNSDSGLIIARQDPGIAVGDCSEENRKILKRIGKLKEIETLGGEIIIETADVTSLEQMQAAVTRAESVFGRINGVIHCAGELDYAGVIQRRTHDATEKILAPKVRGTLVLDQVFDESALDFFVVFSSLSSIVPPVGQVGHCAANAFLDVFAHYRTRKKDQFTVSINWDAWKEVGTAQEVGEKWNKAYGYMNYSISDFALSPQEGIEIFNRCLDSSLSQVVVCTRDLSLLLKQESIYKESPLQGRSGEKLSLGITLPQRQFQLSAPYIAPKNEIQQKLVQIWQNFLDIEPVGIQDDFYELGVDSLMAITLAVKIHKTLDVQVPIPVFFSQPTIERVARYIESARRDEYCSLEPVEKKQGYVLSSAQKRLFITEQMIPGSTAYNETSIWILEGQLEREKLENVFKKLVQRHESFRTSIVVLEDQPFQQIHDGVEFETEYEVLAQDERAPIGILFTGDTEERVSTRIPLLRKVPEGQEGAKPGTGGWQHADRLIKNFVRPFNLFQAPLLRVKLIDAGEGKYILMMDMHHMITDGISYGIIIRDFLELYRGGELPGLPIQYKDFSQWQSQLLQTRELNQQEKFWQKEFAGKIPVLALPLDYPRPGLQSFEGDMIAFALEEQMMGVLKEIARKEDTTLYTVLLALFNVLLAKISGQKKIVVGTPASGRRHADLENIVGMFVNTLAIKSCPSGEKTFCDFLKEIKTKTLDAFENQDYPFEKLVEKRDVKIDTSRNPIFDVMFIFLNIQLPEIKIPQLKVKPYHSLSHTSKFDITLTGGETAKEFVFILEYCRKLFKKETIEKIIEIFLKIIEMVARDINIKIKNLGVEDYTIDIKEDLFSEVAFDI
jgi:amino acid adenylation domain-containing protein